MKENLTPKSTVKRVAFLNCFDAKLFVADVEMSEAEEIHVTSALEWLREAGVLLLPCEENPPAQIGAAEIMDSLRGAVGDTLIDAAFAADPTRQAGTAVRPAAVMPVWPFEAEGGDPDDRDVLVSTGRLWGADVLVEALRVNDPENPTPVVTVRPRFDRWVKAAGGSRLRGAIQPPGEKGCYFLAAAVAQA